MTLDRRSMLAGLCAAALATGSALAAPPTVTVFEGAVTEKNAGRFFAAVADQADKIVGVKATIDPTGKLVAEPDGEKLVTYVRGAGQSTKQGEDIQLTFAGGFSRDRSFIRVDGFFIVKYAGMGQGISAYALEPVKESEVLLSGAKLKKVQLR